MCRMQTVFNFIFVIQTKLDISSGMENTANFMVSLPNTDIIISDM